MAFHDGWLKLAHAFGALKARMRSKQALDLAWPSSALVSPVMKHGPGGSELSFLLSPVNDDTFAALLAAKRDRVPVRLRSLRRPLALTITEVERVASGARVAGRVAYRTRAEL
ncbi:MAG TPA: hypothetical protein VM692_02470 [Gammaproteobacteria bacterium]|nr:hypothetical protein [Gammaproteobacteria bacterium]